MSYVSYIFLFVLFDFGDWSCNSIMEVENFVYNIGMYLPLKVGITEDYTIFVTSPNPYFKASSIEGAVIDGSKFAKKPSRWTFSVYGGFGAQYGLINKQIDIGPQVSAGIGFRIF